MTIKYSDIKLSSETIAYLKKHKALKKFKLNILKTYRKIPSYALTFYSSFLWKDSNEGFKFWLNIAPKIGELEETEDYKS